MSIEELLKEQIKATVNLTDAVNKSNELAERMIGLKSEAIDTVKAVATKPAAEPKKAEKAEKASEPEAPKTDKAPEPEKASEPEVKLDPIAQAISDYVGTGYDASHEKAAEERKARSAKVKEIFAVIATKAGVEVKKHTDIPESFHAAFLKTISARAAEGNLVIGKQAEDEDLMG